MTSAPRPPLILLASVLCLAACDRAEDAAVPATAAEPVTPALGEPVIEDPPIPVTTGPRDAPAGEWSVRSYHPRLHGLDDGAWAEFTLEFLSGVVETKAEADGLRLLRVGRGSVVAQAGFLPGDLLVSVGSARPPTPASLHETWALGERTHWAQIERQREDSTDTVFLWMRSRPTPQTVVCALARLGVVRQGGGRYLIDRALLQALAETPWLYQNHELWQSLGVPQGAPVLRVDDENVGKNGRELASELISARADRRTFALVVGTDDGDARLEYEIVEDLLDAKTLGQIRASPEPVPRRDPTETPSVTTLDYAVEKKGEHHYSVDRKSFEEILSNPTALVRSARIIPNHKDRKVMGFKLYGIRRSSLLSELGFVNGDLISSVQDQDLTGIDDALETYSKLSTTPPDTIRVGVVRRGTEFELKLDLE